MSKKTTYMLLAFSLLTLLLIVGSATTYHSDLATLSLVGMCALALFALVSVTLSAFKQKKHPSRLQLIPYVPQQAEQQAQQAQTQEAQSATIPPAPVVQPEQPPIPPAPVAAPTDESAASVQPHEVVILGKNKESGRTIPLSQAARRQGLYIIGVNGTGKSTLISNMIIADLEQGLGLCLLDPHSDLTKDVLSRVFLTMQTGPT